MLESRRCYKSSIFKVSIPKLQALLPKFKSINRSINRYWNVLKIWKYFDLKIFVILTTNPFSHCCYIKYHKRKSWNIVRSTILCIKERTNTSPSPAVKNCYLHKLLLKMCIQFGFSYKGNFTNLLLACSVDYWLIIFIMSFQIMFFVERFTAYNYFKKFFYFKILLSSYMLKN